MLGRRVLLVGAKSGAEQLPPFPEPDHRALPTACGGVGSRTPRNYQNCEVKFLSAASHVAAYPPVRLPLPSRPPPLQAKLRGQVHICGWSHRGMSVSELPCLPTPEGPF